MVTSIVRFFYPDIEPKEIKKLGLLALTFFFTIGPYWLLRLLKDLVIYKLAFPVDLGWSITKGADIAPMLKIASVATVIIAVAVYTKLIDCVKKHQLFYIIGSFYAVLFAIFGAIFSAQSLFGSAAVGKNVLAVAGIANYLVSESFGSLIVALFWSFTVSSTTSVEAKKGFPFIITVAQIGSILGSALVFINLCTITLFSLTIVCIIAMMCTIAYLVKTVPAEQMKSDTSSQHSKEEKKKPSFWSGVRLLFTKPYLIGIFVVSTFYEVAAAIVEYIMKRQAAFIPGFNFKQFLGIFGVAVNGLAFVMALLGTAYVMKRFGIRICLMIFPIVFALGLIGLFIFYKTGQSAVSLLWATFALQLTVKALSYALNNPVKEMMYIPTSKDAKFKTKSLIDSFGNRTSKATGAAINSSLISGVSAAQAMVNLYFFGTIIGLCIIAIWMLAAFYVGKKNTDLIKNKEIIE